MGRRSRRRRRQQHERQHPGPRLELQRSGFRRLGSTVSSFTAGVGLVVLALSHLSLAGIAVGGPLVALASPFLVRSFRTVNRIVLEPWGLVIHTPTLARYVGWESYKHGRTLVPTDGWDDDTVAMPAALADVTPSLELVPPDASDKPTRLQAAAFTYVEPDGVWRFRLLNALLVLRSTEPEGDWARQLAAVFQARTRYNGARARQALPAARPEPRVELPEARVVAGLSSLPDPDE